MEGFTGVIVRASRLRSSYLHNVASSARCEISDSSARADYASPHYGEISIYADSKVAARQRDE